MFCHLYEHTLPPCKQAGHHPGHSCPAHRCRATYEQYEAERQREQRRKAAACLPQPSQVGLRFMALSELAGTPPWQPAGAAETSALRGKRRL